MKWPELVKREYKKSKRKKGKIKLIINEGYYKISIGKWIEKVIRIMKISKERYIKVIRGRGQRKNMVKAEEIKKSYERMYKMLKSESIYERKEQTRQGRKEEKKYEKQERRVKREGERKWRVGSKSKIGEEKKRRNGVEDKRKIKDEGAKIYKRYKRRFIKRNIYKVIKVGIKREIYEKEEVKVELMRIKKKRLTEYMISNYIIKKLRERKSVKEVIKKVIRIVMKGEKKRRKRRDEEREKKIKGLIIKIKGRVTRSSRASVGVYKRGRVPKGRERRRVREVMRSFETKYGKCNVKVWIW